MKIGRSEKVKVMGGHRKVKCEISQALVMINLYVKFNVQSGRTAMPDDDNRHPPTFQLRLKNHITTDNQRKGARQFGK